MLPRPWQECVQDIYASHDFAAFWLDSKTTKAVQLNLIVIGEAANHIPAEIQAKHLRTPWHLMRAIRNRLVYVYFAVDADGRR